MNTKEIIRNLTLREKIDFCTGADFWHTKALPKLDVSAIMMCDGPHGLRCQKGETDRIGVNKSLPATCFPAAVTAGATWNRELYAAEGEAIGTEALAEDVAVVLGPGCNIKRNPLGGRNFEYLSEDPYLAGKMAAAFIQGQQSTGAVSSLKHFAANNQEYKRQNGDSQADERTLREIYLTGFEIAVKEGKPGTVMCAYNKINGVHCSDNKALLTDILRTEWSFDGMVVTDWGALNDRIKAFQAGCDLNMPGGSRFMENATLEAVEKGSLSEMDINASVERILKLVEQAQDVQPKAVDFDAHHALAQTVAEQGAVLLKNEDNILPLQTEDVALIGRMAKEMRYQGSGSSHINPTKLVSLTDAMPNAAYIPCCDAQGAATEAELQKAVDAANSHKIAIVTAGLPDLYESEGFDREHMGLPEGHNRMIGAVAEANPNTVVVLFGGSVMELPWADKVKAILYMGLPGQAGGQAAANLLTGKVNPSGKLTESWPISYDDVISKDFFGVRNPEYREGIYVGYRYYEKADKTVRYPFGHGLSYTSFTYSDLKTENRLVTLTVTNTGSRKGAEVVQLYIASPKSGIFRPEKELKGFARVELEPGENKSLSFELNDRSFAIWQGGWKVPSGTYRILVGASSRDIRLEAALNVEGEELLAPDWQMGSWYETLSGQPSRADWEKLMDRSIPIQPESKKGSFTMDNSCAEMKDSSLIMKIQYNVTANIVAKGFDGKKDLNNPDYRMTLLCATDCPLRSVIINSNGSMSDAMAEGFLHFANGHILRGIKAFLPHKRKGGF